MNIKRLAVIPFLSVALFAVATAVFADSLPSGERVLGRSTLEPAYNDSNGSLMYLLTPFKATTVHSNPKAWAPIYIPVYPTSVVGSVGTLNCMHVPSDNCPDHGPEVAAAAAQIMPSVYGPADGSGVLGHDHLADGPGGSEFNIAWEPILVLFTNTAAASEHLTTDAQVDAAVARGDAIEVPVPELTFNCSVVPARVYDLGTPVD
jgi:hypothetical protein